MHALVCMTPLMYLCDTRWTELFTQSHRIVILCGMFRQDDSTAGLQLAVLTNNTVSALNTSALFPSRTGLSSSAAQ